MKKFSGQLYHIGINFLLIPGATISDQSILSFQQEIRNAGLSFSTLNINPQKNGFSVIRNEPSNFQITIATIQPPVSQLAIIAPQMPKTTVEMFYKESVAAVSAYQTVWSAPAWQIIRCDATIRELHETESDHAFKELWEKRLHQSPEGLKVLGNPVVGGGLRFVMVSQPNEPNPVQIEVKVESFLTDAKKMFIESQFTWLQPSQPSQTINVQERLESVKKYLDENVLSFMEGGADGNK
jgi:hypothetical protein